MTKRFDARLVLADGTIFEGRGFGARGETSGEVVFNTSLTGYQEVLTDPSYRGQIVVMTYPLIGNYGVCEEDNEAPKPVLSGFVVRELSAVASSHRAQEELAPWLARHGIIGIQGFDTRMLTRRIRDGGAQTALVSTEITDRDELLRRVAAAPPLVGRDLVREVSRGKRFLWNDGFPASFPVDMGIAPAAAGSQRPRPLVVAIDYGAKQNIFRCLVEAGFELVVLPSTATAADIMAEKPDGVFLSNGPGDPAALPDQVAAVRGVLGLRPLFGICLGHQLLAQAVGATTFKLKFGHHGGNQPVKNLKTGVVEITAQNHGFAVDTTTLPAGAVVTHVNLNDGTCEGFALPERQAFCVQYHPEAAPGPHDSLYLFREFRELVDAGRAAGAHA